MMNQKSVVRTNNEVRRVAYVAKRDKALGGGIETQRIGVRRANFKWRFVGQQ